MGHLVTNTVFEHVDELIPPAGDRPPVWGDALQSVTPVSMAIRDLALRTVALETAVREIASELQKLLDEA